jgi:hypothetical protein
MRTRSVIAHKYVIHAYQAFSTAEARRALSLRLFLLFSASRWSLPLGGFGHLGISAR